MWNSAGPPLCEFYPGICLTTEEKARKNLSQGKQNLSQSTYYENTHTLPKHPHMLHTKLNFTSRDSISWLCC